VGDVKKNVQTSLVGKLEEEISLSTTRPGFGDNIQTDIK